jgi:uncharacterized protein YndB with AHSA1/START domain
MYGFSVQVDVKAIEPNKRILVEWPAYGWPTTVGWRFTPRPDGTTFVSITSSGFSRDQIAMAIGSTEGISFVLAGAKALLEQGVVLNLVRDRHPDGLPG